MPLTSNVLTVDYSQARRGVTHTILYFTAYDGEYVTAADKTGNPLTGKTVNVAGTSVPVRYEGEFYGDDLDILYGPSSSYIYSISPALQVGFKIFRAVPLFPNINDYVASSYSTADAAVSAFTRYSNAVDAWERAVDAGAISRAELRDADGLIGTFVTTTPIVLSGYELQTLTGLSWRVTGSDFKDLIEGTPQDDLLFGAKGQDEISGGGGSDRIYGGQDADILNGGAGNDFIYTAEEKELVGDQGGNSVHGNDGDDEIHSWFSVPGSAGDTLWGDAGKDTFFVDTGLGYADTIKDFDFGEKASDAVALVNGSFVVYSTSEFTKVNYFDTGVKKGEFKFDGFLHPADLRIQQTGNLLSVSYERNGAAADARSIAEAKRQLDLAVDFNVAIIKQYVGDKVIGDKLVPALNALSVKAINKIATSEAFQSAIKPIVASAVAASGVTAQPLIAKISKEVSDQFLSYMLKEMLSKLTTGDSPYDNGWLDLAQAFASVVALGSGAGASAAPLIQLSGYVNIAITAAMERSSSNETQEFLRNAPDTSAGSIEIVPLSGGRTSLVNGSSNVSDALGSAGRDAIYLTGDNLILPGNVEDGTLLDNPAPPPSQSVREGDGVVRLAATSNGVPTELRGNDLANRLTGNSVANAIAGGGGNDQIEGRGGNDILSGGAGADIFIYSDNIVGADVITDFSRAEDRFVLGDGRAFTGVTEADGDSTLNLAGGSIRVAGVTGLSLSQWNALILTSTGEPVTAPMPTTLLAAWPGDGALGIAVTAPVRLVFSDMVTRGTGTLVLTKIDGTVVESFAATSSRLDLSGNTLTIDPTRPLEAGTSYQLQVAPGALLVGGAAFGGLASYDFTTAAATTAPVADGYDLILPTGAAATATGSGDVFGTAGAQRVIVADLTAQVTLDPSFNGGGDTLVLAGAAAGWSIVRSGSSVRFSDGDTAVVLPVGIVGADVQFGDGVRTVRFSQGAGAILLGDQVVTSTAAPIAAMPGAVTAAGAIDTSLPSLLVVAPGATATAAGTLQVFGTAGAETVYAKGSRIEFDPSFNTGGDVLVLTGRAGDYTAARSGSTVVLTSSAQTVSLPVGIAGTTVRFADGDRTLGFERSPAGAVVGVKLGDQSVGTTATGLAPVATTTATLDRDDDASLLTPFAIDASAGNLRFTDDAGVAQNVRLTGFGRGDSLVLNGSGSEYLFASSGSDLVIQRVGPGGVLSTTTLVGLADPGVIVTSEATAELAAGFDFATFAI